MRDIHLPDFVYNAMPYIYAGVGLATIGWLREGIGVFSGLTLVSAGLYVGWMRFRYRRALSGRSRGNRSSGRLSRSEIRFDATIIGASTFGQTTTGRPPASPVRLVWRSAFECGHPVIDTQHRQLFVVGNELIDTVHGGQSPADIEWQLNALIDHIGAHFCTEEALLAKTRHPLSEEHKAAHRALLDKAERLSQRFHRGEVAVGELVGFITNDVVINHITKDDRKFAAQDVPASAALQVATS